MAQDDLEQFIEEVTGEGHLRVEHDFGDGFVRLRSAEAERRQAKHDIRCTEDMVIEMLRNSRDAGAKSIFVASSREGSKRRLCVIDDGGGIPRPMWERIFEARVTSKLDTVHMDTWGIHGRGMALYAIAQNAQVARVVASMPRAGSAIAVESDITQLPEKTDQSTRPQFARQESGTITVRGPKNIYRTAAEFAYIDREQVSVFLGSPVEIAAALWCFGRATLSASAIAFCDDPSTLPICKRLAAASTPEQFADIAASLGLGLSSRSARRIMDEQILPPGPLSQAIEVELAGTSRTPDGSSPPSARTPDAAAPASAPGVPDAAAIERALQPPVRSLHLDKRDEARFKRRIQKAFAELAQAYYLECDVEIALKVRKDGIHVTIPTLHQR